MKIVALALKLERRSNSRSGYNFRIPRFENYTPNSKEDISKKYKLRFYQLKLSQITGERVNTSSKIKGEESL